MFARVVMALISSPGYGLGVALAVLPVTIIGNLALGLFGVWAILLPLLILIAAFLVQVVIYVQTARYAGSFCGLKSFSQQPDFFEAAGKGLLVSVFGQVILILAIAAVTVIFLEFRGGEALWWLNSAKILETIQRVMDRPDQLASIFTFEGFDLDGLLLAFRGTYMVFMTMIAIFIVPLACGLHRGGERAYTLGLILVRFLIAMPFMALITGLISYFGIMVANIGLASIWPDITVPLFVQLSVELALFAGMIFSFEALLLKTGREQEGDEDTLHEAYVNAGDEDIRALRQSRMDR